MATHGGRRAGAGRTVGSSISREAREAILREYAEGLPTAEIARRYGVSSSYPTILAGRCNVSRRLPQKTRDAMAEAARESHEPVAAQTGTKRSIPVAEAKRLAAKGVGFTAIAALLRCPYNEIAVAVGYREHA